MCFKGKEKAAELGSDLSSRGGGHCPGRAQKLALVTLLLDPGHRCTEELLERMARKPTVCESEVRAVGGRGQVGHWCLPT